MKIGFRRYFFMFSIALIINVIYALTVMFYIVPYSGGGVQQIDNDNFNEIYPFIRIEMDNVILNNYFKI